jgi:uncharacterized protein DUF4123
VGDPRLCARRSHLFGAENLETLESTAPHLVEIARSYSFTKLLIEMGWGQSWGIFVRIKDASNLRYHLRTFLRVQDAAGRVVYFRYYDPRVLRAYLPTCLPQELETVFGPVAGYLVESEDGNELIEFAFDRSRLQRRHVSVMPPSSTVSSST